MSAAALVPVRHRGEPEVLVGTGRLVRLALRRDRVRLAVWVLALGGLTSYSVKALDTTYPTATDRQARAEVIGNPAGVMLSGPGYGTSDYTLGAMVANEVALTVLLATAIMSILQVVRHTRAEEEAGRAELVRAGVVGRRGPLTAALVVTGLADAAIGLIVTAGLAGSGLAAADSVAVGLGIALTGLVFGAVAAVTAQLTEYARAASGMAMAVLGAAAVVRGVGDIVRVGGSPLSWFSPIAWAQQTRAFVELRWWPLLLSVLLLAVLVAAAYRLVARRDVGAGLLPPRPGPADASWLLSGPAGLAARLQRASMLGWGVSLLLLGVVFGSLTKSVTDVLADNQRLADLVRPAGGASFEDSFVARTALYLALTVAAFVVGSVLRVRAEESAGRAGLLLAGAVDRRRFLGGSLAVTAGAAVLLLVASGLGTGIAAAAVTGDAGQVGRLLGATLVPLPAVLVVAALAAALVGLVPRLAALAWVVVSWVLLLALFGPLLGLPGWVLKLSPFGWVPAVPAELVDAVPLLGLTLLAAALGAAALAGFRRRDLVA
ncbi:MAG: ABC transporter permease [Mycobacteriales bacterium]